MTLPLLYAMQLSSPEDRECIREAVRRGEGDFVRISRIVTESGALEKCRARALEEVDRAREAISVLGTGQFTNSLIQLLALSVKRDR